MGSGGGAIKYLIIGFFFSVILSWLVMNGFTLYCQKNSVLEGEGREVALSLFPES